MPDFAKLLPDEPAASALAFFATDGVTVARIYSDNGSCYRSNAMRGAGASLNIKHRLIGSYTPKTNGEAEHFIQIFLREWGYAHAYSRFDQRSEHLPLFLHNDSWHRPQHSFKRLSPTSRPTID